MISPLSNEALGIADCDFAVVTTGGTISRKYNPLAGELEFGHQTPIREMLEEARITGLKELLEPISINSKDMQLEHRQLLANTIDTIPPERKLTVVTHGTDTIRETARFLYRQEKLAHRLIIMTGAMVPFSMKKSDALPNLASAISVGRVLASLGIKGTWCVLDGILYHAESLRSETDNLTFDGPPIGVFGSTMPQDLWEKFQAKK